MIPISASIKVFYTNGVLCKKPEALKAATEIKGIIKKFLQNSRYSDFGVEVELCHNDSVTDEGVKAAGVMSLAGGLLAAAFGQNMVAGGMLFSSIPMYGLTLKSEVLAADLACKVIEATNRGYDNQWNQKVL